MPRHSNRTRCSVFAFAALAHAAASNAATLTESSTADSFSNDRLAPTDFALDYVTSNSGILGFNVLTGQFGRTAGVVDLDYLHLSVPEGYALSQVLVGNATTVGGSTAFIGLASGPTMAVQSNATSAAGLLGWHHFGNADKTTDILDDMAVASLGSAGFARPLPAGDYTVWLQELTTGSFTYRLNFVITPVPLPAASWVFGSALLGLVGMRRR